MTELGRAWPSTPTGTCLSGTVNYAVNRRWVFRHRVPPAGRWSPALRYAVLAAVVLVLNVVLLEAVAVVVGSVVVAKAVTELTLFLASFVVQRHLVFGRRRLGRVAVPLAPESVPNGHMGRVRSGGERSPISAGAEVSRNARVAP
jgi:putative flippase GtrA